MGGNARGQHGLFRRGAFLAARGHRPSINVRISPPEHLARLQCSTLYKVPSLEAARVAATAMAHALHSGAVLDRLRVVSARYRRR